MLNFQPSIKMSETDNWFSSLSSKQKLQVLGYCNNWDYDACTTMTKEELITIIGFPPKHIDNSNPLCPVVTLQGFDSITDEMFQNKWNEISAEGKEQIRMNINLQ